MNDQNETSFTCQKCEKIFRNKGSFTRHMNTLHKNEAQTINESPVTTSIDDELDTEN